MLKRITAIAVAGVFVCSFTMTAWKACGPKLPSASGHLQAAIIKFDESKSGGAHKPCVALKSSFDLTPSTALYFQNAAQSLNAQDIFINLSNLIGDGVHANDPSPPSLGFPFHLVPIFQLNSNLRI
jgi:hypothetical protein